MARFDYLNELGDKARAASPLAGRGPLIRRLLVALAVLVVGWTLFAGSTTYIGPYEAGVRQSRYGGGIAPYPWMGPVLAPTPPGVTFHRFPTVTQTLNLISSATEGSEDLPDTRTVPSLEVDSSDGSKIRIDATIMYRITDPVLVMTRVGPGQLYEDNAVIPKAMESLKEALGRLDAEDFYSETLRVKATEQARLSLNEGLKEYGLHADFVLIRQYYYLEAYQGQIEERKVQDQLVFTNQSMGEAAREEAARQKQDAEGEAAVAVEAQRGKAEVAKIRAEADLYSRRKRSEGDLLVALANARGTELENDAYKVGAGADNLVGLEMAEVLDGIDVIFVQGGPGGTNVLDLNQTLRMFDVGGN